MRVKIILPNFLAVLILGVASFFFLRHSLGQQAEEKLRTRLVVTAGLFSRAEALRGYELLNEVNRAAMSKEIVQSFAPVALPEEEGRTPKEADEAVRQVWFKRCVSAIQQLSERMKDARPDLVVLTDKAGTGIVRNVTPNACPAGTSVAEGMPVAARALDGAAAFSLWSVDDSPYNAKKPHENFCQLMNAGLMEVAAAPIWLGEDIVGALVMGFELSNGTAEKYAQLLGTDVALVKSGEVYSSSLETDTARSGLEQQLRLGPVAEAISRAVSTQTRSTPFEITVEGTRYLAVASPAVNAETEGGGTVTLVMGSVAAERAEFSSIIAIIVFTALCLLIVFIVGVVLTRHFLDPVVEMEEGILKVINGDFAYRFDIHSAEFGGLGYRINQMVGVLTGEDDDTSDEV